MPEPTFLSMSDVALILGVTEPEARALVQARLLRGFLRGKQMMTRPEDLGAYLRNLLNTNLRPVLRRVAQPVKR